MFKKNEKATFLILNKFSLKNFIFYREQFQSYLRRIKNKINIFIAKIERMKTAFWPFAKLLPQRINQMRKAV